MFIDFDECDTTSGGGWTGLAADEALLLWSMRRLVVAWPRCRAVEVALHRRWGDDGTGIAQLLRCWLGGLSVRAERRLTIGDPACPLLLADERRMLLALRHADDPARALPVLAALCGAPGAAALLPVAAALRRVTASS